MSEATLTREDILRSALEQREQEVMHYQINIDNFSLALAEIESLPVEDRAELASFASQLRDRLASETLEQKKAKLMLAVLAKQVASQ